MSPSTLSYASIIKSNSKAVSCCNEGTQTNFDESITFGTGGEKPGVDTSKNTYIIPSKFKTSSTQTPSTKSTKETPAQSRPQSSSESNTKQNPPTKPNPPHLNQTDQR